MRLVHLGLGNFHRAHQAVYTGDAGDGWQVTGVAHRSRAVVDALRAQGHRYTVVVVDRGEVTVEPVDVVTAGLVLADDPAAVAAAVADPETAVVTLTVTEKGYAAGPDGRPGDMLAALAAGLRARARGDAGGLTVVSCDNLAGNGGVLRSVLRAAAGDDDAFAAYLDERVGFPSTMVDRIVPATTARTVDLARAAGFDDAVPVPAEPFSQWVIQPDFRGPRPAWERAGAVFTDDVAAWETVKVRLLNGVHSLLAYLGLLRGDTLIAQAHAAPAVRAAAEALADEYRPTLRVPAGLDVEAYRAALARRFANTALGHRCRQVGTDGSVKLTQRVPAAVAWYAERGQVPGLLALTVAAWLRCLAEPGAVAAGELPPDPAAERLGERGAAVSSAAELARRALIADALLGEDLAAQEAFVDRVGQVLGDLRRHGADAVARDLSAGARPA